MEKVSMDKMPGARKCWSFAKDWAIESFWYAGNSRMV